MAIETNAIKNLLENFRKQSQREIQEIVAHANPYAANLKLPIFSAYLIGQTKEPALIFKAALDLRDKTEFVQAREQLSLLRKLHAEPGTAMHKEIKRLDVSLLNVFNEIRRKYHLPLLAGDVVSVIHDSAVSIASWKKLPKPPEAIKSLPIWSLLTQLVERKSFSVIHRSLVRELTNVSKLGVVHDQLTKRVVVNGRLPKHHPRTEEPQFRHVHARFKSPM
ncbi:MAG: hypothetical protein K1X70_09575 [Leptospirales bacterium]|nr:hypothetical protein [Leptospirales bacterium]